MLLGVVVGLVVSACGGENTKLMVTGLDPDKGDSEGNSYIRIRGNRFTADGPRIAKVYFGGQSGKVIRFLSDTELVVQPPGGKANEVVDVLVVFEPGGTIKIPGGYRYFERRANEPTVEDLNINRGKK
jgi:hypothetical protein